MQYLEIVQYLIDELDYDQSLLAGTPGTILASSTDSKVRQMRNAVNRAYRHIWTELGPLNEAAESSASFNTAANVENYALPATIEIVQQVRAGSDPPIRIEPWHEYERKYRGSLTPFYNLNPNGTPIAASIYQRNIYFYPMPASVFTVSIRGRRYLQALVNDADAPVLPTDGHHAIFEWALYFLYLYENNSAAAGQREIAMETLKQLKSLCRAHEDIPPAMISVDWLYSPLFGIYYPSSP